MKLKPENCLPFVRTSIYTSRNDISDAQLTTIIEHYISVIGNVRGRHRCDVIYSSTLSALDWLIRNNANKEVAEKMQRLYSDGSYEVWQCPRKNITELKHDIKTF